MKDALRMLNQSFMTCLTLPDPERTTVRAKLSKEKEDRMRRRWKKRSNRIRRRDKERRRRRKRRSSIRLN
jgi:hypothetical protein